MAACNTCFRKIDRCFDAAFHGNLPLLKRLAKEFDKGEGLEKTFATLKDHDGLNALHWAAQGGQTAICDYLVNEMKLDIHSKDETYGYAALHYAVNADHVLTARYLIKLGADVSMTCLGGYYPLHIAASYGYVKMMELLICSGADIEPISPSDTPLHMAANAGKADAVEFLLNNNANPNSTGANCITPLIVSVEARSLECVKLLLKGGADPNLVADGIMPFFLAKRFHLSDMVKCMQKHGAVMDPCGYAAEVGVDTACCGSSAQNKEKGKVALTKRAIREYNYTVAWLAEEAKFCGGILCYGSSAQCKEEGRDAFKKREYHQAATWFTKAINLDPTDETLFSNRSLCWLLLSKGDKALDDALACVKLKPNWSKAHYREGAAYKFLQNYEKAAKAFGKAWQLDPDNKEILKELHEVQDMVLGVI